MDCYRTGGRGPGRHGQHRQAVAAAIRAYGLAGLAEAARPGRPPTYSRADRDRIIALTLEPPTGGATHWSARRLGERVGMSETTVWRIWQTAKLKPHRVETFKFSTDPALEAKVRDVVGLYMLHRSGPSCCRSMRDPDPGSRPNGAHAADEAGQVERHNPRLQRNGTTSLFAALEVATGKVTTQARARQPQLTSSLFCVRSNEPIRTAIWRSCSTTSAPTRHQTCSSGYKPYPRVSVHFTPTSASWMNQIETWFGILSRQAIRRGELSVGQGADRTDIDLHGPMERGLNALPLGQDRRSDPRQGGPQAVSYSESRH